MAETDYSVNMAGKSLIATSGPRLSSIPEGPKLSTVNVTPLNGTGNETEMRVRIKVPPSYLQKSTVGRNDELAKIGGIIFPYTPSISYDNKADYSTQAPLHSNYTQYFYQRSSVGAISITGKFTVQNEKDAGVYLSTVHLLKALTKMRFGADDNAGSPPPVCRLFAYGTHMIDNVPIAIASFRVELPDNVDYFTMGKLQPDPVLGKASVPVVSTVAITCYPMYSRQEMLDFSVSGWLKDFKGDTFRKAGYL